MKESVVYRIPHMYRDDFRVKAFTFGEGEKALCVVGSARGNEYQQIFICSRVMQRFKQFEEEGRFIPDKEVMVIPSINPSSMNIGKRFWCIDNTDINRMFPGYDQGETTQRIAAGVFETVNKYRTGVQLTSFYMPGEFQPHVRMMRTGFENIEKAKDFGLPYVVVREPRPYDTTTLNFNWQIWETDAFSLYSSTTARLDLEGAEKVVDGIERFMILNGILKGTPEKVKESRFVEYDELINVRAEKAGLYYSLAESNSRVTKGQPLARVIDPVTGEVLENLTSPVDGVLFFQYGDPLILAHTSAVKILKDEA